MQPPLPVIVSAMVVVADSVPDVPVIVTVDVPAVAVALAVNVTTLVPVVGLVPKAAVTPLGKPVAARVTLPVNLFTSETVIVSVPVLPCAIERVAADGEIVKLGVEEPVPTKVVMLCAGSE